MVAIRRPLFTGCGKARTWNTGKLPASSASSAVWHLIVVGAPGTMIVLWVAWVWMATVGWRGVMPLSNDPQIYIQQMGEAGYPLVVEALEGTSPRNCGSDTWSVLRVLPQLDSPEFRDYLASSLSTPSEGRVNIALALCSLGDERGLPVLLGELDAMKRGDIDPKIWQFGSEFWMSWDLLPWDHYCFDQWVYTLTVVEATTRHLFPGETVAEKQDSMMEWYRGGMPKLERIPLEHNGWDFDELLEMSLQNESLIPVLVHKLQMSNRGDEREHALLELFERGVVHVVPSMSAFIKRASSENELPSVVESLRRVFHEADVLQWPVWKGKNARYDKMRELVEQFENWWAANERYLKFSDGKWTSTLEAME